MRTPPESDFWWFFVFRWFTSLPKMVGPTFLWSTCSSSVSLCLFHFFLWGGAVDSKKKASHCDLTTRPLHCTFCARLLERGMRNAWDVEMLIKRDWTMKKNTPERIASLEFRSLQSHVWCFFKAMHINTRVYTYCYTMLYKSYIE